MFKRLVSFLKVDLGLFNDGDVSAPSTPSNEGSSVGNAPQGNSSSSGQTPLSAVVYGKQEDGESSPDAQGSNTQSQPIDRATQYAKFKEEYKDLYGQDVEGIIKGRFKKNAEIEQQLGQYNPLVSLLKEKYGESDINKLTQRLQDEMYESIADQKGWTPEEVKDFYQTKNENQQLKSVFHQQQEQEIIDNAINEWNNQAKDLKKEYPDFDFQTWTQNKQFVDLLGAGISVKQAYELCDINNIKANVAKQMEQNVISNIQAKGKKISENGTKPSPGMTIKSSVSDLTKADRAEIARRAMLGDQIKF